MAYATIVIVLTHMGAPLAIAVTVPPMLLAAARSSVIFVDRALSMGEAELDQRCPVIGDQAVPLSLPEGGAQEDDYRGTDDA